MVMAALLRTSYELSEPSNPVPNPGTSPVTPSDLTPQERGWAEKAVKKYAEVQGRKWHRWNEAMFEKV